MSDRDKAMGDDRFTKWGPRDSFSNWLRASASEVRPLNSPLRHGMLECAEEIDRARASELALLAEVERLRGLLLEAMPHVADAATFAPPYSVEPDKPERPAREWLADARKELGDE